MPELITPSPSLLGSPSPRRTSIENDLRSLEDQLRRCSRGEPSRWHASALTGALGRFLHRHLVSIVVLLVLLSAVLSLGA